MEFNLAQVHEAVEATVPDRDCVDLPRSAADVPPVRRPVPSARQRAPAPGLGEVTPRDQLGGHESGQDHLAIYLHNGNEYLEAMLGSYKARVAPFNVNYRYVAEELRYLLDGLRGRERSCTTRPSPRCSTRSATDCPASRCCCRWPTTPATACSTVPSGTRTRSPAEPTDLPPDLVESWSPDDLYILYTGGTTGMPKGVLWRQADIFVGGHGRPEARQRQEFASIEEITATVSPDGAAKMMPGPPFMHGAAHWMAFNAFTQGSTLVIPSVPERLDCRRRAGARSRAEGVNVLLIVGDAFARPLIDEIEQATYDLSSLLAVVSGGAALSAGVKARLLELLPSIIIMDGLGASETGQQGRQTPRQGPGHVDGRLRTRSRACASCPRTSREVLPPGHDGMGWLAQAGRVPLGYLGDADKSARTFPVIDGVRYSVPGDRARLTADGRLELFGRDSVTINSGGEKIFAEEVEQALVAHPAVVDCVVAGRPSRALGQRGGRRSSQLRRRRRRVRRGPPRGGRPPHRPLQAAQGLRSPAPRSSARRRARPTTAGPRRRPPMGERNGR